MYEKDLSSYINPIGFSKNFHINANKLNKAYDSFFLLQYLAMKNSYKNYPVFSENQSIKTIINGENLPTLIIFQGFFEQHIASYFSEDENLDHINVLNNSKLGYTFSGFVNSYKEFNYILLKDNFQSWYFINFDKYLSKIAEIIVDIRPSKLTTVGFSAGGFASILFGHMLGADNSIAYSPQILAFYHYNNKYRQALNAKFNLSLIGFSDLAFVQRYNSGFDTNVHISVASDNVVDNQHLNMLDLATYSDINVTYIKGGDHNIFAMVDKDKEFERVARIARV